MKGRMRFLLVLLVGACLIWGLRYHGRSLWFPLLAELQGKETVASVLESTRGAGAGLTAEERQWIRTLTLVALKEERFLEVWGHPQTGPPVKIRSYPFFGFSGESGPKLREGDGQIPEGHYRVESLNPNSSYHLSIKIDYPNRFDREKGKEDQREKLGFDIFIHGKSVTIGCIPIGDEAIEDLFALVGEVGIAKTDVIIAPWDFRVREDAPSLDAIEWEDELYRLIRESMAPYRSGSETPD